MRARYFDTLRVLPVCAIMATGAALFYRVAVTRAIQEIPEIGRPNLGAKILPEANPLEDAHVYEAKKSVYVD